MNYNEALSYIHSVSNFFCKPGLERIRELCLGLGDPQEELSFVHVGGTNGKGSVCAMTDAILREAGYKVGLFTSPYVVSFNERIRINGENITEEQLVYHTERARTVAEKMTDSPTEFELITAIALDFFREEKCDVVVFEVGMGGALDATNLISSPLVSIITGISLDHTAFLGDTVEKIAKEKSGIIKRGCPSLFGGEEQDLYELINERAVDTGSMLYRSDYSLLTVTDSHLYGSRFNYRDRAGLEISMAGRYQPRNGAIVLDCIDILNTRGLNISEEAIRRGLAKASWPARFEVISHSPTVIFDGAHNPQGISAAVNSLIDYFGGKRLILLTGVLKDKDYLFIAKELSKIALRAYTITPNNPRALPATEYAEVLEENGISARPSATLKDAMSQALADARNNDTALICLGSLYIYGDVINEIKNGR